MYQDEWLPVRGEILTCQHEMGNAHDPFAVKVVQSKNIVGHLPKKISSTCSLFLRREGVIVRTIKDLLNKSDDPYLAILAYRSTPLENGYSPAELLISHLLSQCSYY